MLGFLLVFLIHHHGWVQPHNPHHARCDVAWHVGCAAVDPPPVVSPGFRLPPPVWPR